MNAKRSLTGALVGAIVLYARDTDLRSRFREFLQDKRRVGDGRDRGGRWDGQWRRPTWHWSAHHIRYWESKGYISIGEGAKACAIVGGLLRGTVDFDVYSTTNIANLTRTLTALLLESVHGGMGGAVIALVRGSTAGRTAKLPDPQPL